MAEDYGSTGGGKYAGSAKKVGWDIGAGSARTTGGTSPSSPPVSWDIGSGAARTTGPTYAQPAPSIGSFSSNPSPYIAPVSGYQPQAPMQQGLGGPSAAPATPSAPVGGAKWYGGLDQGARAAQDQSWLGGDSDYTAQIAEYDRALQTFIDRIMNQKKTFNQDADDAVASTGRNQAMSLDALGEDFGARGLSYSGMFDTTKNQTNERFNEAKGGIEKVRSRNLSDADNREADYRTENQISRGNAERSSLSRQAQRQALLDSMAGF